MSLFNIPGLQEKQIPNRHFQNTFRSWDHRLKYEEQIEWHTVRVTQ